MYRMPDPADFSAPASAPAFSGLAIGIANTWDMLDDLEDDVVWHDTFDHAAHCEALNPFAAQPLVYPADEGDEDFAATLALVEAVKTLDIGSA
jgi:hypothetical protein